MSPASRGLNIENYYHFFLSVVYESSDRHLIIVQRKELIFIEEYKKVSTCAYFAYLLLTTNEREINIQTFQLTSD